jgi:hypothetical protein
MNFTLSTSGYLYRKEDKEKLEKLGFKFESEEYKPGTGTYCIEDHKPVVNIDTLETLIDFIKIWGQIVLDVDTIKIYDDYID